jgi:hypothetical protein
MRSGQPARRGDRHKTPTVSLRLPADLRAWAEREAAAAGIGLRPFLLAQLNNARAAAKS